MLYIFCYWLVVFVLVHTTGTIAGKRWLKITSAGDGFFLFAVGLFIWTVAGILLAGFLPLKWAFIVLAPLWLLLVVLQWKHLHLELKAQWRGFWDQENARIWTLLTMLVAICALSASQPSIYDNETYYLPTIQWLHSDGWIRGLANLHPFLAQQSAWHVAEALFQLPSGVYFNDLNGLALLVFNVWFIYGPLRILNPLRMLCFLGFNALAFTLLDSPSPDLMILLCAVWVLLNAAESKGKEILPAVILITWATMIKITAITLLVVPFVFWSRSNRKDQKLTGAIVGFVALVTVLKNTYISGWPLYPLAFDFGFSPSWQLPERIMQVLSIMGDASAFGITYQQAAAESTIERLPMWLLQGGVDGGLNLLFLIVLVGSVWCFIRLRSRLWLALLLTLIVHTLLLFLTSPQSRFFMHLTLAVFGVLLLTSLDAKGLSAKWLGIPVALLFFYGIGFLPINQLFHSHMLAEKQFIKLNEVIVPHFTSCCTLAYDPVMIDKRLFLNPQLDSAEIWRLGSEHPAANRQQLHYFEKQLGCTLRCDDSTEGFYRICTSQ